MNTILKEAALIISKSVLPIIPQAELIEQPSRLYALACDFLCEPKFSEAKRLIRKGCDSGVYALILEADASSREVEGKKAAARLVDSELLAEEHAREIVAILLIALSTNSKSVSTGEAWVDECNPTLQVVPQKAPTEATIKNAQTGNGYDVYLVLDKNRKLDYIKAIRQRFGWGLVQAKDFVEGPTLPIVSGVSAKDADELCRFFANSRVQTATVPAGTPYKSKTNVPPKQATTTAVPTGSDSIESQIKRIYACLKSKSWTNASKQADTLLGQDATCAKAYLAKLLAEYKLTDEKHLELASTPPFSANINFKRACNFANAEERKTFKKYESENAYAHGVEAMKRASSEKAYKDASVWFASDLSYKDSRKLYDECLQKAETERKEALYQRALLLPLEQQPSAFEALSGYRDADRLRSNALYTLNLQQKEKEKAIRRGKALSFWGVVLVLFVIGLDVIFMTKCQPVTSNFVYAFLSLLPVLITSVTRPLISKIGKHPYANKRVKNVWIVVCFLWGGLRGVWGAFVYLDQFGLAFWDTLGSCAIVFALYSVCYFISAIIGIATVGQHQREIRRSLWGILLILVALAADVCLVLLLKDHSPLHRWLWLPLLSFGISAVTSKIIKKIGSGVYSVRRYYRFWTIPATIWGIGRGIIILIEHYQSLNGIDSFGTALLFLAMFLLNGLAYFNAKKMSARS